MAGNLSSKGRRTSRPKSKQRKTLNLQKPSGAIGPRVKRVGGDKFAIVCVDPAKQRSEWMMADYFGNLLLGRQTLEHQAAFFKEAVAQIHDAQQTHDIQDMIVVVERTGNYHLPPKRAFSQAGFETRVVHPFRQGKRSPLCHADRTRRRQTTRKEWSLPPYLDASPPISRVLSTRQSSCSRGHVVNSGLRGLVVGLHRTDVGPANQRNP